MQLIDCDTQQQQQYWDNVVERVAAGDQGAQAEFCCTYRPGIRLILQRRIGGDEIERMVEATASGIVAEISAGRMTTVSQMARFIREVVPARRPVASARPLNEADRARLTGRVKTLDEALATFSSIEREALICFYARGFSERDVEVQLGYDIVSFRHLRERLVRTLNGAHARRGPAAVRPDVMRGAAAGAA